MISVLDEGYVALVEAWGADERVIEAARMSTGKGFLGWGPHPDQTPGDEKLLAYLWRNQHSTPFEMAGMTIEVQAPIVVIREWMRHRTQSYSEFSARYSEMPDLHYVPESDRLEPEVTANKQAQSQAPLAPFAERLRWLEEYKQLQAQVYAHYKAGLALGIPKEVARLNTPVSRYSRMRVSANLLNWLKFLKLRMDRSAQYEIRMYARAVGEIVSVHFPRTWALAVEGWR